MKEHIMNTNTQNMIPFNIRKGEKEDSVTLVYNGKPYSALQSDAHFKMLIQALQNNDYKSVGYFLTAGKAISHVMKSANVEIKGNRIFWNGKEQSGIVVNRITEQIYGGYEPTNLINFLDKQANNPDEVVKQYLYSFLEHKDIAIDNEGFCWGYKAITNDWKDKWTQKLDYRLGQVPTMPRSEVNCNPNETCGAGYNLGGISFVRSYACGYGREGGDRIVLVRFDPEDVCCVPYHATEKLRCCKFEVMQEFKGVLPSMITNTFNPYESPDSVQSASYLDSIWQNWNN